MFQAIRRVIHSFSTGAKQLIPASTVVLAISVENKPQTLSSPWHILPFNVKNAVLAVDFKQKMHQ